MSNEDYKKICLDSLEIVKKVGQFIRTELGQVKNEHIQVKGLNSLVSYVDESAEVQLVEGLREVLPEAGFLTEEGTVEQGEGDLIWIIDPLDGTNNFLHSIPHFAISVGLRNGNNIVVGIVLSIMANELFYAWKGGGAYLNEHKISVSQVEDMSDSMIATGFPYSPNDTKPLMGTLEYFIRNARGVRRYGAAALDLAFVACGRFDCYYETTLNAWDVAGGALLVEEAGGQVTDFGGGNNYLFGGQIITSNGKIHKEVSTLIRTKFGV